jgi:hypothetical protein
MGLLTLRIVFPWYNGGMRYLLLVMALAISGCDPAANPKNVGKDGILPVDYKNGVYYFPCNNSTFGNSLSQFIESHKDLEVTAIAFKDYSGQGYFVVTKQK